MIAMCLGILNVRYRDHLQVRSHLHDLFFLGGKLRVDIADVMEALKEKLVSQDEEKKAEVDIQKLTDKYVGDIDAQLAAKEKEILQV